MTTSRIATAEHRAPVSKVDRTSFVILLSVSLLQAAFLLVEINCGHGFRRRIDFPGEGTHKVEHASRYDEIGGRTACHIQLVTIDQREDM
jgi:hypothetical protein